MDNIVLNFANQEEYNQFMQQLKQDILKDIKPEPAYSSSWIAIREDLERKLKGNFNFGCGNWYQNQTGVYSMFRLAFQKERVQELRYVDSAVLQEFYKDLIGLIEKYRERGE